jgi:isocitrate dehydrogenase (NAD+)
MTHTITLIPGDGIGPEVTRAAVRAVEASGATIRWEEMEAGAGAIEKYGKPLPDNVLESLRRTGVGLKGPIATPVGGGFASVNVALRKSLDLYVNYRPARALPGIPSRYADLDLDLVLFRENTEGLYSGLEHEVVAGVVESLKIITEKASRRIARYAFEFARQRGRKRVTALHKANIMKLSDGLFLRCAREIAKEFPAVQYDELIIDNACMQLVLAPEKFDVLVAENLYGDIVSDLCAGLVGGLGLVPGANIGDHCAVFEAVHGSAPDIAGKGLANPTALMRAAVQMLSHIGQQDASKRLQNAIRAVYAEGKTLTRDIGGKASTEEFTDAVVAKVENAAA